MRNLKEIRPILAALYCINFVKKDRDEDMDKILKYAFRSIFDSNTNLITLACIGKTKEQIMPEIWQVLEEDTKFKGDKNND